MRYFWVIGGGLLQVPILEKLRSMDIKTIVSDASDQCVCAGICDYFVQVDIFDIDGHIAKAEELIKAGDEVIGVLAAGIDAPVNEYIPHEFREMLSRRV